MILMGTIQPSMFYYFIIKYDINTVYSNVCSTGTPEAKGHHSLDCPVTYRTILAKNTSCK